MQPYRFKIFLFIDLFFVFLLILYRFYLVFIEEDYVNLNVENVQKIERIKDEDITFAVLGNIKNSISVFDKKIIPMLNNKNIDFIISLGNAVCDGGEDKYRLIYRSIKKLDIPFINVVGVDEISSLNGLERFYKHFGPFNFSFLLNGSAFIFIDTTGATSEFYLKRWLLNRLKQYRGCKNILIFMNKPLFLPKGELLKYFSDNVINSQSLKEFFYNTLSEYNVDAVFSSNLGIFYNKNIKGVDYYITGGAGGFLLDEDRNYHHYLLINIDKKGNLTVNIKNIKYISRGYFSRFIENFWLYIHSVFYVSFVNFIIILALLLIIIIYIYNKLNREVEYYDYSFDYENLKIIKPLNIAMFTNNYLPFLGGVPTSIYRLSKGLARIGLKPIIFAPSFDYCRSYKVYYKDGIEEIRFKYLTRYKKFNNIPIANIFNPNISKIFEEKDIDIVHVHHPFWMGRKGMRLSKIYGCPLVLTYHTRLEKYSHYVPIGKKIFKNILSHFIIKNFAKKCDLVIAPTTNARDYLKNIGVRCKIEILPTGVDFDLYRNVNRSDLKQLENKYKDKPDEVILITVSRLSKEKNLYFIIDGIKTLKNLTDIPFKLLIIGGGYEKEALESYIKKLKLDKIAILVGEVLPENIAKYYIFSDIFVFASTTETQGLVLLEAMAGGCPVVAVQSSGIDDIINNDYNGYKTSENIYSWAEKIKIIIENREKYNELSKNALKHVNKYSIELIAEKVAKLYTRLLIDKKM